ncbi:hypothetical protein DY000_02019021 [Brassica cretica]|uniref:Rubisco LSMT substrate-binding domain-containing protein n=1 Tax=Brassica cretica TaxID=69181 RepID=A0ABQ7CTF1_BRACR|nr:hypothetical protein DY000_02019021 [Brassica cretica]
MNLTQRGTASQLKSRKPNTARDPRRSSPEKNSKETKSRRRRKRRNNTHLTYQLKLLLLRFLNKRLLPFSPVWCIYNSVTLELLVTSANFYSCAQNVSLARRFALVPLGPPLLAYCSNCKAMLTAVDGAVQLVVDRPYKAGDPIVVWCGPQPNAKLLLNYGFVDEDNPYDRIIVEAALSTDDPQYQDKRLVAQRNGKLSQQVFQVRVGKEKEAVQDMLPYLRLGYMSDPAEMQSVISSQGPVCSMSPCMERAVLDQLADYFMRRLAGYPTTLKEDDALLADPSLNPRKRVATRLVRLEKKMLAACLVATVDLLNELPDTTISPCPAPYAPSLK